LVDGSGNLPFQRSLVRLSLEQVVFVAFLQYDDNMSPFLLGSLNISTVNSTSPFN
jgi:hypothetical protein